MKEFEHGNSAKKKNENGRKFKICTTYGCVAVS